MNIILIEARVEELLSKTRLVMDLTTPSECAKWR